MAESKKKQMVVTSSLVAIKTDDGRRVYLYRGAEVGEGFDKEDVKRLEDMNLVGEAAEDVVPGVGA
jgi:hypothetical protein